MRSIQSLAGLCSVSFRKHSVEQIVSLAVNNGLEAIEWGADVHASPSDLENVAKIRDLCAKNGILIPSYGSYFRCDKVEEFERISLAASALGAFTIRVWVGSKDSEQVTEQEFDRLVDVARSCAAIAAKRGQTIAFEHHFGTFCNNANSTLALLKAIDRPNVKTYWQTAYWRKKDRFDKDKEAIAALKEYIVGVHVYHWIGFDRFPLQEGEDEWKAFLPLIGVNNYFLEFVKDDDEANLAQDAATLKSWLKS